MQQSSEFCRVQEELQRALALDSQLENSRRIATIAADAWAKEGALAMKWEARGDTNKLDPDDAAIAEEFRLEDESQNHQKAM
ncbi:hypothetical protein BH10PSE13_BH10PSE13_02530 [soil metagenome]